MVSFAFSKDDPGSSVGDRLEDAGEQLEGS